jgi:hypothetical protein
MAEPSRRKADKRYEIVNQAIASKPIGEPAVAVLQARQRSRRLLDPLGRYLTRPRRVRG